MTRRRVAIISVGVLLAVGTAAGSKLHAKKAETEDAVYHELELFTDALSIIQDDYVEQPDAKQLVYGALKGMLQTLDPYSQFLDPDSYNELKIDTEGQFGGLGIEITVKDDLLTIISPIDDTPAFKAGLKSGDRIVKIDGQLTRGITLLDAVKKLRGKSGTQVNLTVLREGENELKDYKLTRDIIKIQSIRESRVIDESIGYVRVSDFRENTSKDLEGAVEKLREQKVDGMILDLRNNPGGLLDVSVTVSELFLARQQMVVSTKGRLRSQNLEFRSRRDGLARTMPLVVLINEGSASASEIVAGAIQDHRRGIILGTKSHGKASVQTIFPLKDGSALRLTTSKYFTPNGRSIHGEGITPDVVVPFEEPPAPDEKDKKDTSADNVFRELEKVDGKDAKEEAPLDNQLARAVDLLKGIRVYQASLKSTN
jgi:carboxyl-terminal processing protease